MRLYSAARPADLVGDLCPGCGSLLEPAGEIAELVGFRAIKLREGAADESPPSRHERIAGRVEDFFARGEVILGPARLDADRWIDDGGSFSPEAVAGGVAPPIPVEDPVNATAARLAPRYRCPCEHAFQVFGQGRHRRFYELDDGARRRPVMARVCPSCQRRLPTTRGLLPQEARA